MSDIKTPLPGGVFFLGTKARWGVFPAENQKMQALFSLTPARGPASHGICFDGVYGRSRQQPVLAHLRTWARTPRGGLLKAAPQKRLVYLTREK
jgi:hypothetical protein